MQSTSYSSMDFKSRAYTASRKQDTSRFSHENVDEESIEENTNQDHSSADDVEEAVMVAFDRSGESGELRIVTDPEEIKSIELEEQERKRNVSFTLRFLEIVMVFNYPLRSYINNINLNLLFFRRLGFR